MRRPGVSRKMLLSRYPTAKPRPLSCLTYLPDLYPDATSPTCSAWAYATGALTSRSLYHYGLRWGRNPESCVAYYELPVGTNTRYMVHQILFATTSLHTSSFPWHRRSVRCIWQPLQVRRIFLHGERWKPLPLLPEHGRLVWPQTLSCPRRSTSIIWTSGQAVAEVRPCTTSCALPHGSSYEQYNRWWEWEALASRLGIFGRVSSMARMCAACGMGSTGYGARGSW